MKKIVQQQSVDPDALYTPTEVGALIKLHPESVRRAVRQERIEAIYVSRGVRVTGRVVLRILANGLPAKVEAA